MLFIMELQKKWNDIKTGKNSFFYNNKNNNQ